MLLRQARSHALLSQAELGERAGVARSVIADYERGRNSPTVRQLDRLLAAAGLLVAVQLKPLSADLDTAIRRCLARPVADRLLELPFHLGALLRILAGVPYGIEVPRRHCCKEHQYRCRRSTSRSPTPNPY